MCVICVKPAGTKMPPSSWIENMWYSNPDGAGFMYADGKKVYIQKGYMNLKDFEQALKNLEKKMDLETVSLVMHFRIGTAGGNTPANTHPFPISDSIPVLQKLTCTTTLGVAHNGIIPVTPRQKDISDTMEYIAAQLSPLYRYDKNFYRSSVLLQMIGNITGSKLAFMNPQGEVYTVGQFIEDNGLFFSNSSYLSGYWYRRGVTGAHNLYDGWNDDLYYSWKNGDFDNYGMCSQRLMMLTEDCYVVDMDSGNYYGCDTEIFFIDSCGFLYVYSDPDQCCYQVTGDVTAYTGRGYTVRYDDKEADVMLVDMDTEIDLAEFMDPILTTNTSSEKKLTETTSADAADTKAPEDEKDPF